MSEESQNREQLASELQAISLLLQMDEAWSNDSESFDVPVARFEIVHNDDGTCDWKVTRPGGDELPHDRRSFPNASEAKDDARERLEERMVHLHGELGTNAEVDWQ